MKCPKCGTQQPDAAECARCGVVVAKWGRHKARRPPRGQPDPNRPKSNEEQLAELKAEAQQAVADAKAGISGFRRALDDAWDQRPIEFAPRAEFLMEMGKLLEAGLPMSECFAGLSQAARAERMGAVVADLQKRTAGGERLFTAMARWPTAFDAFDCKLVELGLRTGQAAPVFAQLSHRARARGHILSRVVGNPERSPQLIAAQHKSVMVPLTIDSFVGYIFQVVLLAAVVAGLGAWSFRKAMRVATDKAERADAMAKAAKLKPASAVLVDRRNADLFTFLAAALRTGIEPPKALGMAGEVSDDPELSAAVGRAVANIDPKTWMAGAGKDLPGLDSEALLAFDPEDGDLVKSMHQQAEVCRQRLVGSASKLGRGVHYGLAVLLAACAFIGSSGGEDDGDADIAGIEAPADPGGGKGGGEGLQGGGEALHKSMTGGHGADDRAKKALEGR